MSKSLPTAPFVLAIRRRHLAAGERSSSSACAIAKALDEAFPEVAGEWSVSSTGAVLLCGDTPRRGLMLRHDGADLIRRFDFRETVRPGVRVRFAPAVLPRPGRPYAPVYLPAFAPPSLADALAVVRYIERLEPLKPLTTLTHGEAE